MLLNSSIQTLLLCSRRTLCTKPDQKVNGVVAVALNKYMNLLGKFEKQLETSSPKTYSLYRKMKDGTALLFSDMRTLTRIGIPITRSRNDLSAFTRYELEVFRQMPSDLLRMFPVITVSLIPFMQYVAFPIAFMFPRRLLSRHFWSPAQRIEFAEIDLGHRLHHYPTVLSFMHKHVKDVADDSVRQRFNSVIAKLEKCEQLNTEEIVQLKPVFVGSPFGIEHLSLTHIIYLRHLAKGLKLPVEKNSLMAGVRLLSAIDAAIVREGINSISLDDLQQICFTRGLNAKDLSREELVAYVERWTAVSKHVTDDSLSLLLHAPLFLAYTMSANQKYLHKKVSPAAGKDGASVGSNSAAR